MKKIAEKPVMCLSGLAIAFSSNCLSAAVLEEVIVTAQKRTQNVMDVPNAIAAFTSDSLEAMGIRTARDIAIVTPALVVSSTGPITTPTIRGVGGGLTLVGLDPSVVTYIDDRVISRPSAGFLELENIDRVEVLKGPQGTLYGRNAAGGAIRVITKPVVEEVEGNVRLSAGNYDYGSVAGTANVPLTDNFGTRISGAYKTRDGYADNLGSGTEEYDDQDYWTVDAKFRWDMSDTVTANLILGYWEKDDTMGQDYRTAGPLELNRVVAAEGPGVASDQAGKVSTALTDKDEAEEYSAQLRFDVGIGELDFVSITTYTDYDIYQFVEADTTEVSEIEVANYEATEDFYQEFQLLSPSGSDLTWIVGANYYYSEGSFESMLISSGLGLGRSDVDTTAWAVFGQLTYSLSDQFSLVLGGRFSDEEKDLATGPNEELDPVLVVSPSTEDSNGWDDFTPEVILKYDFDYGMAYVKYAAGFKSGGYNFPAPGTPVLDPENLDMYEIGLKADVLDGSVRLDTSLYYYDYQDLQVTRSLPIEGGGISLVTDNAAEATTIGLDFDATWLVTDDFSIVGGFTWMDGEYDEWDASAQSYYADAEGNLGDVATPGLNTVPFDASGEDQLRVPDFSGFVSFRYVHTFNGGASLPMSLTYSYTGEYDGGFVIEEETSDLRRDSVDLVNARISYVSASGNWEFAIWGNNLTDEEYPVSVEPIPTGLRQSDADPRTYGADFNYLF